MGYVDDTYKSFLAIKYVRNLFYAQKKGLYISDKV